MPDDMNDEVEVLKIRRLENAEKMRRVNSATLEPPATICEVCGLVECEHSESDN